MQIMLGQRTWQGVTFNVNYTYAKAIGDVDTSRGGYPLPAGVVVGSTQSYAANRIDRTWQSNAQKERLVVYGVWERGLQLEQLRYNSQLCGQHYGRPSLR